MHIKLSKKYIFLFLNILFFIFNVKAEQIYQRKEKGSEQYLSQIIWEKVKTNKENNRKPIIWEIDKNSKNIKPKSDLQEGKKNTLDIIHKKNNHGVLRSSSLLLRSGEKNLDYGFINNGSYFYALNLGLTKKFNLDFSSELINSKNNATNPNKFKSTFLEKGSRTFRGGGTLQIFSKSRGDLITTNLRLSYGQRLDKSGNGYIFGEIINKYKKNDRLSFNLNPRFSYTNFGNIYSISTSLNLSLSPKFEIIPEANINLNNAENNFSLTGRTFLSKNILIDTFVSNSLGIYDMAKQFKSESTKYGVKLKIRL